MKINPGSDKAIEMGCTCPVLDNGHGNEQLGKERGFWISGGCPTHDKRLSQQSATSRKPSKTSKNVKKGISK